MMQEGRVALGLKLECRTRSGDVLANMERRVHLHPKVARHTSTRRAFKAGGGDFKPQQATSGQGARKVG